MDNLEIMVQLGLVVFAAVVTLIAALIDVRKFIIPNWCSLAVFVTGVAFAYFSGSLVTSFAVGLALFFAGAILFQMGFAGGGDVKLLAAAGVWAGVAGVFDLLLLVALGGGVLSVVYMAVGAISLKRRGELVSIWTLLRHNVPYGVAICAGAFYFFVRIIVQLVGSEV